MHFKVTNTVRKKRSKRQQICALFSTSLSPPQIDAKIEFVLGTLKLKTKIESGGKTLLKSVKMWEREREGLMIETKE